MSHIWVLAIGFFFANFMCLIAIWNNYSFNSLDPKYIGSSYDPNRKEELDSLLLKSLEKHIKNLFNIKYSLEENIKNEIKFNSSLFLGQDIHHSREAFILKKKIENYQTIKNSESSKFSMFLDNEKENIIILKISNEENKINKYDSKNGEVILYSIPVENFIPLKKNNKENHNIFNFTFKQSYIEKSLIKKCWSSKFFGRIIGAVASADKQKLSIFYSVVKGHTVTYRIRYFHNISCGNNMIENSDLIMIENFNLYLDTRKGENDVNKKQNSFIENYFEISDEINNYKDNYYFEENGNNYKKIKKREVKGIQNNNENNNEYKDKIFKNYFDDDTYDDFLLKGNTPVTAMAIKEDIIAYARDLDYRQFYILKREKIVKNLQDIYFEGKLIY